MHSRIPDISFLKLISWIQKSQHDILSALTNKIEDIGLLLNQQVRLFLKDGYAK